MYWSHRCRYPGPTSSRSSTWTFPSSGKRPCCISRHLLKQISSSYGLYSFLSRHFLKQPNIVFIRFFLFRNFLPRQLKWRDQCNNFFTATGGQAQSPEKPRRTWFSVQVSCRLLSKSKAIIFVLVESSFQRPNFFLFSDILDALTQDFFARKGNPIEEPAHVEEVKVYETPFLIG